MVDQSFDAKLIAQEKWVDCNVRMYLLKNVCLFCLSYWDLAHHNATITLPPSHSWYHWKALNEQGSTEVVLCEQSQKLNIFRVHT
jgi:hypothetical protein